MQSPQLEVMSEVAMNQQLPTCRVCLESTQPILTLPCRCLSHNSYIHWTCLRRIEQFRNKERCDVCKSKFQIQFIQVDGQQMTSWDCQCGCDGDEFCQMFMLVVRIAFFVGGFMLALTPIHIKMDLLRTYVCIGVGSLLVYISNRMTPDTRMACSFCQDCLCHYLCCINQCNSRRRDIKCCWCIQYQSWIPRNNIGLTLRCREKEVRILY